MSKPMKVFMGILSCFLLGLTVTQTYQECINVDGKIGFVILYSSMALLNVWNVYWSCRNLFPKV